MAELPHLILPRAQIDLDRRKRPGFGTSTKRDPAKQLERVTQAVEASLESHSQLSTVIVNPELIVRVRMSHAVPEEQWTRAGLSVLGHDDHDSVILFSSDTELQDFRTRLRAYGEALPEGQKNPQYDALIGAIEDFGPLRPQDRIGSTLRAEGFHSNDSFTLDADFTLDIELWEIGSREERAQHAVRLDAEIAARGGELADRYIGESFTALRVIGKGETFRWLLDLPIVRSIDRPPRPDIGVAELLEATIEHVGNVAPPDENAPLIAIVDSGINSAHPILASAVVDSISAPESLGVNDGYGHGTRVSGIAAYGNVRESLALRDFQPVARLASGKIVNDVGNFDARRLVPSQMDDVVRRLHALGCRIFNISLGDRHSIYSGGKVGAWTAVLDLLARELDILFVVAAGNYEHLPEDGNPEDHLDGYPNYLVSEKSRILEPATAVNVLTVGAIAHSVAVPEPRPGDVGLRPIAGVGEPAPFTRCGPTVGEAIKPELCDDGGNIAFDGVTQGIVSRPECEVFTINHEYLQRLFTTVRGTSYAAPLVSHKAAIVLRAFPGGSANLIRALLTNSARLPGQAVERLQSIAGDAASRVCGYGIPNVIGSTTSDTNRVVLYADAEIGMDKLFVYEVPIPPEFAETKGNRQIRVTLAFDAPTRHTRASYLGVKMSFRLVRGKELGEVIEHFRKRNVEEEGKHPDLDDRYNCKFDIGPQVRECGTLQSGTFTMRSNPAAEYGNLYHLVVRCERTWHPSEYEMQRFAVVVELTHTADIPLYERIRERVTVRIRS